MKEAIEISKIAMDTKIERNLKIEFKKNAFKICLGFVICLMCLCGIFHTKNKQLTEQINRISSVYEENLEEKDKLSTEIHSLSDQLDIVISEMDILTKDLEREMYDETAPLYTFLYEDLYVEKSEMKDAVTEGKKVYLTFDDGPTYVTRAVLDTLAEYDIKATFFILGSLLDTDAGVEILKRIQSEGHTIAVHTDTHDYNDIYKSVPSFLKDLFAVWDKVYQITGEKATLYRFPGGSVNSYNKRIGEEIKAELYRRGFVYFDWNVSSDDSMPNGTTISQIIANATNVGNKSQAIVLMHDSATKMNTALALPSIIEFYKEKGYEFDVLTDDMMPVQF